MTLAAVVEMMSYTEVVEAMPPDVRGDIIEWVEAVACAEWPGPQYIGHHRDRPGRPPCVWAVGIRWEGEAYAVAVSSSPEPDWHTIEWMRGCPVPPPISAYRWAVERSGSVA